jgi:hypothetical protein
MEQLQENLRLFDTQNPLTPAESDTLKQVMDIITERVPCTACRYCVGSCPKSLDIPMLLTMYNEAGFEMGWFLRAALGALKESEKPGSCSACGKCSPLCPQEIDIPKAMKAFSEML